MRRITLFAGMVVLLSGPILAWALRVPELANVQEMGAKLIARLEQFIGNYPDLFEEVRETFTDGYSAVEEATANPGTRRTARSQ